MGFCGEMRLGRTPEKGTGGSGEGRGDAWAGSQAMLASLFSNKKELPPSKHSILKTIVLCKNNIFS